MGRRLVPSSTIKARMDAKDLRFEREARLIKAKADRAVALMTHEERQELIRRPVVFNYIGGKAAGGTSVSSSDHLFRQSIGGGFDSGSQDTEYD